MPYLKTYIAVVIAFLFLQGCVGVGILGNVTSVIEKPEIGDRGKLYLAGSKAKRVTPEFLKDKWGEPDEIRSIERKVQRWDYRFGYRWNGLDLAVVVPLPLFVPVGREHIYFYFKDDELARSEIVTDDLRIFAGCTFLPSHLGDPGCEAGWSPRIVKDRILDVTRP